MICIFEHVSILDIRAMHELPPVIRRLVWDCFHPMHLLDAALTMTATEYPEISAEMVALVPRPQTLKRFRKMCKAGRVEKVTKLIAAAGITADDARRGDVYALRIACQNGYEGIVYALIGLGLTAMDAIYWSTGNALQDACKNGHSEIIQALIELGLKLDDVREVDALYWVCKYGLTKVMQSLIDMGLTVEDARKIRLTETNGGPWPRQRYTALEIVFEYNHLDMIPLLLSLGLNSEDTRKVRNSARCYDDIEALKLFPEEKHQAEDERQRRAEQPFVWRKKYIEDQTRQFVQRMEATRQKAYLLRLGLLTMFSNDANFIAQDDDEKVPWLFNNASFTVQDMD